eukprot:2133718-Pyramimonas_sp.AAC.1
MPSLPSTPSLPQMPLHSLHPRLRLAADVVIFFHCHLPPHSQPLIFLPPHSPGMGTTAKH